MPEVTIVALSCVSLLQLESINTGRVYLREGGREGEGRGGRDEERVGGGGRRKGERRRRQKVERRVRMRWK